MKDRLEQIKAITIHTHQSAIRIIDKKGVRAARGLEAASMRLLGAC